MLHFINFGFFFCCTLFMLQFFQVAAFLFCTHTVPFSCCNFFLLHSSPLALFHVALFHFCILLLLHFICCNFFLLHFFQCGLSVLTCFMLFSFHGALALALFIIHFPMAISLPYTQSSMLHSYDIAVFSDFTFSCSNFFMLHSSVLHFFHVAPCLAVLSSCYIFQKNLQIHFLCWV